MASDRFYQNAYTMLKRIYDWIGSGATPNITLSGSIPAGTNEIGKVELSGNLQKIVTIANAVAITGTTTYAYSLITHGGMTNDEIRQYKNFRITLNNTHDQAADVRLVAAHPAFSTTTYAYAGSMLYYEAGVLGATIGRMALQGAAGGTGAEGQIKVVPALINAAFYNLYVVVAFGVAPTSGSLTIKVDMN